MAASKPAAAPKPALPPDTIILVSGLVPDAPTSLTRIPLGNLTPPFLLRVYKASVIALRKTSTSSSVLLYPESWPSSCERDAVYDAVLEDAVDALEDDRFIGAGTAPSAHTSVCISHVPITVSEAGLRAWMTAGLESEQPALRETKAQVKDATLRLASVKLLIEQLPNYKGTAATAAAMLAERQRRAQQLEALRVSVEESLVHLRAKLEVVMNSTLATLHAAFTLAPLAQDDKEEVTETRSWRADFDDGEGAQQLALTCVHKPDWSKTWLAVSGGGETDGACQAGITPDDDPPASHTLIRMAGVRFSRERHGRGMIKYVDARGFVSGEWAMGRPHGAVTQINASGKFSGRFDRGARVGTGTMVHSRGDTYTGAFGAHRTREHASLINGDDYELGAPHGEGVLTFVDGSRYVGTLHDGVPCGRGVYSSTSGLALEGNFDSAGALHGEGSMSVQDRTRLGKFRHGCSHGEGTEIDAQLGTYEGDFVDGMKHGWGRTQLSGVGGLLVCGAAFDMRHGAGAMDYGTIEDLQPAVPSETSAEEAQEHTVHARVTAAHMRTRYRYYGRWRADRVRGRGVFTDKRTDGSEDPLAYTFAHTNDLQNPTAAGLDAFLQRQAHILEQRLQRERAHATAIREARQLKEHENLARYRGWMMKARAAASDVEARTYEQRAPLREMHHALAKSRAGGTSASSAVDGAAGATPA